MKKWIKALALTTAVILMSSAVAAFAEGEEAPAPEPPKQEEPAPAPEPKPEPAPEAPAPAPEAPAPAPEMTAEPQAPAEVHAEPAAPAEAPAEPEVPAETPAEPAAPAETPTEDVVIEEPAEAAEDTVVEIEENETPLGIDEAPAAPVPFTGRVKVERKGNGPIFFGDRVTLVANIQDANTGYDIRWEVNRQDGSGWKKISGEDDKEYNFVITEDNAGYEYRVVLVTAA